MSEEKKTMPAKEVNKSVGPTMGPPDLETNQTEWNRRDFLKITGFSLAALATGCSKTPVEKAIPFLIQPEEIVPGKAYWYASTSHACGSGCAVLVKNRDGRPIKVEGNPDHVISQGGLCPSCQASIIELYDSKRLLYPSFGGKKTSWEKVDNDIFARFESTQKTKKKIVILTNTETSPSTQFYIDKFMKRYPTSVHVEYDPISYSAILESHELNYGKRFLPQYKFDRAKMILSLDADFLGTWLSPVQFTKDYRKQRDLSAKTISRHIHVESRLSITGAKADERYVKSPAEILQLAKDLEHTINSGSGDGLASILAKELKQNQGKSLVISGLNDIALQVIVNRINHTLGNIGKTILVDKCSYQKAGIDKNVFQLISEMEAGKIGALLVNNVNPVYDLPEGKRFGELMKSVPITIAFSIKANETTKNCSFQCPTPHYLESWSDNEFISGILSMTQPVIQPLGDIRSFRRSLAIWLGIESSERDIIRNYWKENYLSRKQENRTFNHWWNLLVHDGFMKIKPIDSPVTQFKEGVTPHSIIKNGMTLTAFSSLQMLDGRHAENPWLQELPDPITKVTWDNVASISQQKADELGLIQGDIVNIKSKNGSVDLPVYIQEGHHKNVVSVALGYGRQGTERFSDFGPKWIQKKTHLQKDELVGKKITHLLRRDNSTVIYSGLPIMISKTGNNVKLALTQTFNTLVMPEKIAPTSMKTRPIIQETTFKEYKNDPSSGSHKSHQTMSLWKDDHTYEKHHWGMEIDLNSCTGCSGCVIACQVENNIPVVGKDEIMRSRDMAWIRIDRYYSGEGDNVDVAFQPMMCQHCDNAPCEPVCPTLATVHSSEGLNQQIYNRCIGTRYCANNCPYKVRRFNWFDYAHDDQMENMVLNPDVTVRSRGVMEKCSLCVQRIQEEKQKKKMKGVALADGDIKTACQQSCPADAIVFGDLNDPKSKISKLVEDPRHYHVLEELNTRPVVGYLTKVKNSNQKNRG